MGFFNQRKPRGFHIEYTSIDRRKEKLKVMEEHAKRELGMPEYLHNDGKLEPGIFLNATKYAGKHKCRNLSMTKFFTTGITILIIVMQIVIWKLLLCL